MNRVLIFADNRIFAEGKENELLKLFLGNSDFSVLPINSLECLEATVRSASTFKACVVDWDFENKNVEDPDFSGVVLPQRTPMSLLMENTLYTLVYIYSEKEIPEEEKSALYEKYGDKIHFRMKRDNMVSEYDTIINDIKTFEGEKAHMNIPFMWSQSINQSVQRIFSELESANAFWIKELRDTIIADGGDAASGIIDVFNNLLNEDLIQNKDLRNLLNSFDYPENDFQEENTAKLYRRMYYSNIVEDSPIMTGDIFKIDDDRYGILITPECELADKKKEQEKEFYDFLIISKSASMEFQQKQQTKFSNNPNNAKPIFNNGIISRHILVSFPFDNQSFNHIALIDFNTAFRTLPKMDDNKKHIQISRTTYKLNAPYIHQLRQRFISYFGKYGVPATPESLREYNLRMPKDEANK